MKNINISIEAKDNMTLKEAKNIGEGIEKVLPKTVKVKWWSWKTKKDNF